LKQKFAHITPEELLARFRKDGNQKWLGILLERYTLLLLGVCMKYLKNEEHARDTVQQVFLKALAEIPRTDIKNIGGWLYQVTRNECLTLLRSRKIFIPETQLPEISQPEELSIPELLQEEDKLRELQQAISHLKKGQREAILLFYFERKSYREIAVLLNCSEKEVKSHIQNGKRNLKLELAASFPPHSNGGQHG